MKRRHFISSSLVGTIGSNSYPIFSQLAIGKSKWQPDGVGSWARIGVLTPDFDPVPESEISAMSPAGISIHSSRVVWSGNASLFATMPNVDHATDLLTGLKPQVILYAFTSSSYELGAKEDAALKARLEKRASGIRVILTCQAARDALRMLSANSIALIHPPWFSEAINAKGNDYFTALGFTVKFCKRIAPARTFTEVSPEEIYNWAKSNVPQDVEAIFIGGNGLRAVGAIHALEKNLRKPILTANQILLWSAMKIIGVKLNLQNYGKIFTFL
jgi:maleate isomerase